MRTVPLASGRSSTPGIPTYLVVLVFACIAVCLLYRLDAWPLIEPDEGRNAEIAREMLASGHWAVPRFDGLPYLDKPVLLFWLVAGAFRWLGVGEAAARLPSALAGIATVALTFDLGRMLVGRRRGLIAAVVVATTPIVMAYARIVIFDLPLTACITAALCCLAHARLGGDRRVWLPLAGAAVGLAVLTKGPVGVAVPLLLWFAGRGALPGRRRRRGAELAAIVAAALVVVPWLVLVERHEPGFVRYALVDETFLRVTSPQRFHREAPAYFYALTLAWALGIWGVLLAALSSTLVGPRRVRGRGGAAVAFAARGVAALLVFFTLSASKRAHYILPAIVPLGVLTAVAVDAAPARAAATVRVVAVLLAAVGAATLAVLCTGFPAAAPAAVPARYLAGVAACLLCWGAVALATSSWSSRGALVCAALLTPAVGLTLMTPLTRYAQGRSSRVLAQHVTDAPVLAFETFRTSLPFYLRHPVPLVGRTAGALTGNYVLTKPVETLRRTLVAPADLPDIMLRDDAPLILARPWDLARVRRLVAGPLRTVYADRHSVVLRREE